MTPDLLDDLLDRSAPMGRAAAATDIAAMTADARNAVERPTRRRRLAITGGVLSVFLVGGAGAAVATDGFTWAPWAQSPDIAYAFTLPSGRACEARILVNTATTAGDQVQTPSATGAALHAWAQSADFDELVDVSAQRAQLDPASGFGPDAAHVANNANQMMALTAEGGLDVIPRTAAGPTEDALTATAVDNELIRVLAAHAHKIGAKGEWSTEIAMQCAAVAP